LQLKTETSPNGFGAPNVGTCTDPGKFLAKALGDPSEPAGLTTDDVALIWLGNQSRTLEVRAACLLAPLDGLT
jgi:hypothetical protein